MDKPRAGLLGASSPVGHRLLSRLTEAGYAVTAWSRKTGGGERAQMRNVDWRLLPNDRPPENSLPVWVCAAPIWTLPDYFTMIEAFGVRKIVAISSTSRFTKTDSSDAEERATARRLADTEKRLQEWSERNGIQCVVLQPTLIYGDGRDKNVAEIARFIRRFGFFPVFGKAQGLRQPIHADDLAQACVAALTTGAAIPLYRTYVVSGGEALPYREMAGRIFQALGKPARFLTVPLPVFRIAARIARFHPRCRHWTLAMAERMNRDMAFSHSEAKRDFGFSPRPFRPGPNDVAG
ncbi:MAG: NAD-dependent epimerase/dehydratase family protein [Candidatus Accumulibacter sp.]|jgi:nucleoside-diphosphate-sugar epimerase|nr:NAD-dependent epimerase/dehydratase family protein [Accumulibacter sp.]